MKVAIVLTLLVAAASASPLLDALDRIARNKADKVAQVAQVAKVAKVAKVNKIKSKVQEKLEEVGEQEKEKLKKLEDAAKDYKDKFEKAVQESEYFALAPLSVDDVNKLRDVTAQKLREMQSNFVGASTASQQSIDEPDSLTELEKLQGLDVLLGYLEQLGKDGHQDFVDITAIAWRAITFGVGQNTVCDLQDAKAKECIMEKSKELEEAMKQLIGGFVKALMGKKEGEGSAEGPSSESESEEDEEEEGCLKLIEVMGELYKGEGDPKEVAPAIVADLRCISDYLGQLKSAVANTPDADESTTGRDVLEGIGEMMKPSMGITANIIAIAKPLVAIRAHMFAELVKSGVLQASAEETAKRALADVLRSLQ